MIKLTPEQTKQVIQHPNGVECQADGSEKTFVIVDAAVLHRMQSALHQKDVNVSIGEGIADMEAGRMISAEEAEQRIRTEFGFSPQSE